MPWSMYIAAALCVVAASEIPLPAARPTSVASRSSLAPLKVGDRAPDFDYQSYDYRWVRFHHMLQRDAVVLVFSPDEATLAGLEAQREPLAECGVAPVAVVGEPDRAVWRRVTRLGLTYSLLSDPHGVIAEAFGAWDTMAHRAVPAWCVVGGDGRIRASGLGLPHADELAATALQALGLVPPRSEPPAAAN